MEVEKHKPELRKKKQIKVGEKKRRTRRYKFMLQLYE